MLPPLKIENPSEKVKHCQIVLDMLQKILKNALLVLPAKQIENTDLHFWLQSASRTPSRISTDTVKSIARLGNMLGGGAIVQRIDDLVRGQRSTVSRIEDAFITPVLKATPVDLGLVLSKRIPDGVIEMIYALNKVAPDTADDIYFALWRLISTYVSKY